MVQRLSILDMAPVDLETSAKQALINSVKLASKADELGYERFWVTEHHNISSVASASPELLIGQIAANTQRIRVGSGGVMLPNHSPLKVAENFKLLETFYPDRIDLGVGRAPGTDSKTALALRRSMNALNADDLQGLLRELRGYDHPSESLSDDSIAQIIAMPQDAPLPPIWILGSSPYSAQLAAIEAANYSFAYHFNPAGAKEAISLYRKLYQANHGVSAPDVILGVSVISGETEKEVEYQKKILSLKFLQSLGHFNGFDPLKAHEIRFSETHHQAAQSFLSTIVIGTWSELKHKLDILADTLGVQELIVSTGQEGFDTRLKLYEKLAELYHLQRN
ncbi:LLM class flavin-dependent oxidoreductase [Peribacillus sp. N1]